MGGRIGLANASRPGLVVRVTGVLHSTATSPAVIDIIADNRITGFFTGVLYSTATSRGHP